MNQIYNQNFWKSTNGPYEEIVYSLAINYNNHVFAGTFSRGVFRATPYGTYWAQTSLINKYVSALYIAEDRYIYAGTQEKGVFRSVDNGVSWTQTNLLKTDINSLSVNSRDYLFAGSKGKGIYYSKNKGSYWYESGLDGLVVDAILIDQSDIIYAGTDNGFYLSENNGESWKSMNNGLFSYDINALTADSKGNIYAGTGGSGLFVFDKNEKCWNQLSTNGINKNIWTVCIGQNDKIFIGTDKGVFLSEDYGNSWENVSSGLNSSKTYALAINHEGYLYAGTFGWGVFKSREKIL